MSSEDSAGRIRSAASLLVKGGTLTSEVCKKCGGVQVRFADKTTCINCGNEETADERQKGEPEKAPMAQGSAGLASVASVMEEKDNTPCSSDKAESDVSAQKQKVDRLKLSTDLKKVRNLMG